MTPKGYNNQNVCILGLYYHFNMSKIQVIHWSITSTWTVIWTMWLKMRLRCD